MPTFEYKAIAADSKRKRGLIQTISAVDATAKLMEQGLFVVSIKETKPKKTRFVMKPKQLADFCKELSLMLSSGLPMVKALNIIASGETTDNKVKIVYQDLHRSLKTGKSLSEAMREQDGVFPELIINMFVSGEMSGTIGQVADKMADYYTAEHKLKKKISQATTYPKVLMFITLVALVIVFAFVLPSITDMLGDQPLPAITQFMKNISDTIVYKWYNVLIAVSIIILVFFYIKTVDRIMYIKDMIILKIVKIGPLLKIIYTARFARTLSSMYSSGINLVPAISISSKVIGNRYIEGQFPDFVKRIKQGELMSKVLSEADGFSKKFENIMTIGEETGKLDEILTFAATSFEYDADVAISSMLAILEPAMLLFMAVIIGLVIVSVLLPIFQMYDAIGGMA